MQISLVQQWFKCKYYIRDNWMFNKFFEFTDSKFYDTRVRIGTCHLHILPLELHPTMYVREWLALGPTVQHDVTCRLYKRVEQY